MKPDWDALMADNSAVFDVDCTADGKSLCEEVGVTGFPTIKWGDPSDKKALTTYEGGRDLASLKKFAEENLAPSCGPEHREECSDEQKALLDSFSQRTSADLTAEVKKFEKDFAARRKKIDKKLSKLTDQRTEYQDDFAEESAAKPKKGKEAAHQAKLDKLAERKKKIDAELDTVEAEQEALKADEEKAGLKFMKAVAKANQGRTDL